MSQTPTDAQIVAEFQNIVTFANIAYSMTALVAYEHIITLEQERTMIWHRKWTLATWLFMINRYLLIGKTIWDVVPYTSSLLNSGVVGYSCAPAQVMDDILAILQNIVFAVFSALRVFALWDRNIPMTLLVLALNVVPVAVDIFSKNTAVFTANPIFGTLCNDISGISANVLFDILFVMDIAAVVVNTVPSFQNFGFIATVIGTLQPILISRFLLNLRQVGSPEIDSQEAFNSQFSIPGFRVPSLSSMVGNMGEDLDHSGPAEEVEAEVENYPGSIQAEEGVAPEEGHPSSMNPIPSTSQLIHIP
ncbi:hypothetical protein EW026_g6367 [Hermanssonia centrifuga]|uniref:DUF6533 domain-containing protein n=1 Tax=Hermanssonia centrifuga TaxID=98765 RepID=A0A4V6S0V6_9APHY|nr:hypothetical protein EW026_g6367 [Hermanssonia centrifuga]